MTVKLVVLYTQPDDRAAFDEHYLGVHAPLVAKLPGLQRFETGTITLALDGGEHTYHRIAELYFADQNAMNAAFGSPEGSATAADYGAIAPPGSRMFVEQIEDSSWRRASLPGPSSGVGITSIVTGSMPVISKPPPWPISTASRALPTRSPVTRNGRYRSGTSGAHHSRPASTSGVNRRLCSSSSGDAAAQACGEQDGPHSG